MSKGQNGVAMLWVVFVCFGMIPAGTYFGVRECGVCFFNRLADNNSDIKSRHCIRTVERSASWVSNKDI